MIFSSTPPTIDAGKRRDYFEGVFFVRPVPGFEEIGNGFCS